MSFKQGQVVIVNHRKFVVISVEFDTKRYTRVGENPRVSEIRLMELRND